MSGAEGREQPFSVTWALRDPIVGEWVAALTAERDALREQVARVEALGYEAGWRDACDDWLEQMRDPKHPIGARKRRYEDGAS